MVLVNSVWSHSQLDEENSSSSANTSEMKSFFEDMEIAMKVVIVGNGSVGKSSMIQRFCKGIFTKDYKKTIGVDFLEKILTVGDQTVRLMLWDTAGQEVFDAITRTYYRGAHACVLACSIVDKESFLALPKWKNKITRECGEIPMVLVANKMDLHKDAIIDSDDIESMARSLGISKVYKTSVKEDLNVKPIFSHLAERYLHILMIEAEEEHENSNGDIVNPITAPLFPPFSDNRINANNSNKRLSKSRWIKVFTRQSRSSCNNSKNNNSKMKSNSNSNTHHRHNNHHNHQVLNGTSNNPNHARSQEIVENTNVSKSNESLTNKMPCNEIEHETTGCMTSDTKEDNSKSLFRNPVILKSVSSPNVTSSSVNLINGSSQSHQRQNSQTNSRSNSPYLTSNGAKLSCTGNKKHGHVNFYPSHKNSNNAFHLNGATNPLVPVFHPNHSYPMYSGRPIGYGRWDSSTVPFRLDLVKTKKKKNLCAIL